MRRILFLVIALLCCALNFVPAETPPKQSLTLGFDWPWSSNLQGDMNHLNRMVGHVKWQFTRYRSDRATQREYWQIRHEVERLNGEFKKGGYDHGKMRGNIERLHGQLHNLEVRLRVKKADYYHWK